MADLGRKYTCYSCHSKFYDLGKPEPICPKCGADQRDAEEKPSAPAHRGRAAARPVVIVEEPPIEDEFPAEAETPVAAADAEEEDVIPEPEREEEAAAEDDEEEEEEGYE